MSFSVHQNSYENLPYIAERDRAFIQNDARLLPFRRYAANWSGFEAALAAQKNADNTNRAVLVLALRQQYKNIQTTVPQQVSDSIAALSESNTFTVTTAHQSNLFLGPLYFVYKILSAIKLAQAANARYPQHRFVPVYWCGSEDHDHAELNHTYIFNRKMEWQTPHEGAFGRLSTASLQPLVEELRQAIGAEGVAAKALGEILAAAYNGERTIADATAFFINALFGQYGLVVINQDDTALKQLFVPYLEAELTLRKAEKLVQNDITALQAVGFAPQATPRNINIFYLTATGRNRIVFEDDIYTVLNTDLRFTPEAMIAELHQNPQNFSPNVVLRPVYQEVILPNVAYVGGGGEMAYWQERGSLFDALGVAFPLLVRRQSALILPLAIQKRIAKTGFEVADFWNDYDALARKYMSANSENDTSLTEEKAAINAVFERLLAKIQQIDSALDKAASAEQTKIINSLESLSAKLLRAEKRKHEVALQQIQNIKERLFPERGLQERYDSFIPYYAAHGAPFFDAILENIEPFFSDFLTFREESLA